jgi:dTDP-4-dehydrorhamnose reductase
MNIGITGASGMLGTSLISKLCKENRIYATSRREGIERDQVNWECFDLLNFKALHNWLESNNFDFVIHCAAMVNVDACEKNPSLAEKLHYKTTKVIAEYLDQTSSSLIYISTDSVFDGNKNNPYTEKDKPKPLNAYARTKLLGENPVLNMKNGLVLRTSIIGWSRCESLSFAEWIIKSLVKKEKINLFDDVIFSPLNVSDLSCIILQAIEKRITGLYNATSNTSISKYEFGLMIAGIFSLKGSNIIKSSIKKSDLVADRPKNMSLDSVKLSMAINMEMPSPIQAIQLLKEQYNSRVGFLNKKP